MPDLTKSGLVDAMVDETDLTKADVKRALEAFIKVVSKGVARGNSIQITGFGTFERRTRKARKARNPQTGEEIQVPKTKVPAFKAGKTLKDMVR